ncbi:MAG: DUF423 domain-containing protein [Chitinophagaceae bacterium]
MHKKYLMIAAWLGAVTVALGAFGAHGLKQLVPPESVSSFDTGVRYQFYHLLALLAIGLLYEHFPGKWLRWSANAFLLGMLLFSGSIYLLTALKAGGEVGLSGIGIITPFGGVSLIFGWIFLAIGIGKGASEK